MTFIYVMKNNFANKEKKTWISPTIKMLKINSGTQNGKQTGMETSTFNPKSGMTTVSQGS
jgi:hypothetical protein